MNSQVYQNLCQFDDVVKELKMSLNLNRKKKKPPISSSVSSNSSWSTPASTRSNISYVSSQWSGANGSGSDFESNDSHSANELGECVDESHQYYELMEGQVRLSDKQDQLWPVSRML